jgi:hypothetical protein
VTPAGDSRPMARPSDGYEACTENPPALSWLVASRYRSVACVFCAMQSRSSIVVFRLTRFTAALQLARGESSAPEQDMSNYGVDQHLLELVEAGTPAKTGRCAGVKWAVSEPIRRAC